MRLLWAPPRALGQREGELYGQSQRLPSSHVACAAQEGVLFYCSCVIYVFFLGGGLFGPRRAACRILVPQPGVEPRPLQWKCRVLTTGPPGKSHEAA